MEFATPRARNGAVSISCEYETAVGVAQTPGRTGFAASPTL